MATKAQEWASKRNSTKWRIAGLKAVMRNILLDDNSVLTLSEQVILEVALQKVSVVIDDWKMNNGLSKDYNCKRKQK